jgi:ABC-type uncharacterized transport system permease subunit
MRTMSRTGLSVVAGTLLVSAVCGVLVPYGYPWPTIATALFACVMVGWMASGSMSTPMSDVIRGVEAESPVLAAQPAPAKRTGG